LALPLLVCRSALLVLVIFKLNNARKIIFL